MSIRPKPSYDKTGLGQDVARRLTLCRRRVPGSLGKVYPNHGRAKMCDASARGAKDLADDEAIKMERLSRYLQRDLR